MNVFKSLERLIADAAKERGYVNYLQVKKNVLSMMEDDTSVPSNYWNEELEGFDYMLDASPLVIRKLREHCYHITGLRSYEYRHHHAHKAKVFAKKLAALQGEDKSNIFIPESEQLGGFGHDINGQLVNIDTLKFYESLIAMDKGGLLQKLQNKANDGDRPIVVEIGGGWGGFGYQIKKVMPNITYVIIDLPQTLLFSATYLKTVFPDAAVFMYGDGDLDSAITNMEMYDFVFLPHYFVDDNKLSKIDLAINMVSFQEMTTKQVSDYVKWLWESECQYIYSHNRGYSPHNNQICNVLDLLEYGYSLQEVKVLPVPYTVLNMPKSPSIKKIISRREVKEIARYILSMTQQPVKKKSAGSALVDYRHMIGERNQKFKDAG